ncbi:hypothetical protein GCM10017764_22800 [Sphingobacterium griseoflavum]|uniref:Uncharacterized protein n=1 Tax=Sphingobacterium griseoflavum TaxID=1474952 RepID=A0ABQ3HZ80_9SPHI|nr:hypothetical protein GCM10017764_22800 [Sphingobacterium griseoflavum]
MFFRNHNPIVSPSNRTTIDNNIYIDIVTLKTSLNLFILLLPKAKEKKRCDVDAMLFVKIPNIKTNPPTTL